MKCGYEYPSDSFRFGNTKILESAIKEENKDFKKEELKREDKTDKR